MSFLILIQPHVQYEVQRTVDPIIMQRVVEIVPPPVVVQRTVEPIVVQRVLEYA